MERVFKCGAIVLLALLLPTLWQSTLMAQETGNAVRSLSGKGDWQSLTGDAIKGTWTVALSRKGGHVQGNLDLTGSTVFSGGEVTGDINGSNVVLGVMADGANQATFSGALQSDGTVSGEWQSDVVKDSGTWSGTLTPGPAAQ